MYVYLLLSIYICICQDSIHAIDFPPLQDDKQQPKGPVNQYNFFSMELRKAIRQGNQSDEVSQA